MDYRVCDLSGPGQRTSEPERREGRDLDEHARKYPCHRVELKIPRTAISLAWSAFASRNRGGGKSGGTRDEIGLWTADPAPDRELTCVEPGSPMGELMRRYWQPVCTSDELRDLPRKEKLLCEEIVVFRDKKGGSAPSTRI